MPAKNSNKPYLANSLYHLYNRGVEKRIIFADEQDKGVFLSYLKEYLLPKDIAGLREQLADSSVSSIKKDKILKQLRMNNFSGDISFLAYCLMPNHFHFLVHQRSQFAIDTFMNSLCTRYSMYFNKKYKRVGPLYQGVYKAVLVDNENQLLHLSRYIHRNPLALQGVALQTLSGQCSSLAEYLKTRHDEWVKPSKVLSYFSDSHKSLSYQSFVFETDDLSFIQNFLIDEE